METVFIVGVIAGAGLMAAVIFGAQARYERRYPITKMDFVQFESMTGLLRSATAKDESQS